MDAVAAGRSQAEALAGSRAANLEASIGGTPRFFSMADVLTRRQGALSVTLPHSADVPVPGPATAGLEIGGAVRAGDMDQPFGMHGYRMFPSRSQAVTANWQAVLRDWEAEKDRLTRCAALGAKCADPAAKEFAALIDQARSEPSGRIAFINEQINKRIRYMADVTRHGRPDVWSTPLAVLGAAGDCEDYAIAKYIALRQAGTAERDLRLVLLRDRRAGEDHAVLAVRQDDRWWVLDNRWDRIDDDRDLAHYRPIFALTGQQVSLFAAPYVSLDERGIGHMADADATLELSMLGADWTLRPGL